MNSFAEQFKQIFDVSLCCECERKATHDDGRCEEHHTQRMMSQRKTRELHSMLHEIESAGEYLALNKGYIYNADFARVKEVYLMIQELQDLIVDRVTPCTGGWD